MNKNYRNPSVGEGDMPDTDSPMNQQVAGDHYTRLTIQPLEYCQRNNLKFCESNAIKYITRHPDKNGKEDIEKAIHCLELLIAIEYSA